MGALGISHSSAADLKSLHRRRRVRPRDFRSKSGTKILGLLVPMTSRSSPKGLAVTDRELRKVGTSEMRGCIERYLNDWRRFGYGICPNKTGNAASLGRQLRHS